MIDKNEETIYLQKRKELGWSRDKASQELEWISPDVLEKIEKRKKIPDGEEVLRMAEVYKCPDLCNKFCATECKIGQQYVPEIHIGEISSIVIKMVSTLNTVQNYQKRLIGIVEDGIIEGDEIKDFVMIQQELEKLSITVESLQLWTEKMIADGNINKEEYDQYLNTLKK